MKYKEYELVLEPDSTLFLYTDGLPEAKNAEGEMFRLDNTLDTLNQNPQSSPKELLHMIDVSINNFVKDAEHFDDLTMLCLHYTGEATKNEIVVDAIVENFAEVKEFLGGRLSAADCPKKVINQIFTAAEELFVNIALYAYAEDAESRKATVRLCIEDDPSQAVISFVDSGIPYDPLAKPDPDVTLKARERKQGGLGIYIVKKFMDDMSYEYKDGQNVLTITKQF